MEMVILADNNWYKTVRIQTIYDRDKDALHKDRADYVSL